MQVYINRTCRADCLQKHGMTHMKEYEGLVSKLARSRLEDPILNRPLEQLKSEIDELKKQLSKHRSENWRKWVQGSQQNNMNALYRSVRKAGPDYGKTQLIADPWHSTIDDRIKFTKDAWAERWKSNKGLRGRMEPSKLGPITEGSSDTCRTRKPRERMGGLSPSSGRSTRRTLMR